MVHTVKFTLVMAKILFLFTKLRGESELETGGIVEREPDRKRQTDRQTNRGF